MPMTSTPPCVQRGSLQTEEIGCFASGKQALIVVFGGYAGTSIHRIPLESVAIERMSCQDTEVPSGAIYEVGGASVQLLLPASIIVQHSLIKPVRCDLPCVDSVSKHK